MIIIEPSILAADYTRLGEQVLEVQAAGAQAVQVDIMDGHFVPNLTFGPGIVEAIRKVSDIFIDVHLMVAEPDPFLEVFAFAGANRLIVHQEACLHLYRTLQMIRGLGVEAGVCLNPGTPTNTLDAVLHLVDLVQVMTVNPGFGGQAFLRSQLDKIKRLKQRFQTDELDIAIAVDGGIDVVTAPLVVQAGATVLIAGSSVYNQKDSVAKNFSRLASAAEGAVQKM